MTPVAAAPRPESLLEALDAGATVITATARLQRRLRRHYDAWKNARGFPVWDDARALAWGAWLSEAWGTLADSDFASEPALLLREEQERALWERMIEAHSGPSLLHVPATAVAAAEAWALVHDWELPWNDLRDEASPDAEAFLEWAGDFRQQCHSQGWITRAELPAQLAAALRRGDLPPPRGVLFAGFDRLTPAQQSLARVLSEAGCPVSEAPPERRTGRARRLTAADPGEELRLAAHWARRALESGEASSVSIVVPNLDEERSRVERIFQEAFHPAAGLTGSLADGRRAFRLSAPPSLAESPLVSAALLALELAADPVPLETVEASLRSPFFQGGVSEAARRARLARWLRKQGAWRAPAQELAFPERWAEQTPRWAGIWRRFRRVVEQTPPSQPLAGWARTFSSLLAALGWPGERSLNSDEAQTAKRWQGLLDAFSVFDLVESSYQLDEAAALLARMARETRFQPEERGEPVQIVGLLETAGLTSDRLWVTGMADERWPRPARPNPFLPRRLQRSHGLPRSSAEGELEFARRLTGRLLAAAADVVFSYPAMDGEEELRPSPLILPLEEADAAEAVGEMWPRYMATLRSSATQESFADTSAPPLEEFTGGGARLFQDQAACPFRAFAHFRLRAGEVQAPEPGLSPQDRGWLLHEVMRSLWNGLRSHGRLVNLSEEERQQLVAQHVAWEMESLARKIPALREPRMAELERARLIALIGEWLRIEAGRAPFEVVQQEAEREAEIGGVTVTLRPDRIDRLPDGRLVLLDYKTGEVRAKDWEGERPDQPQLPLYAVTTEGEIAGIAFAQMKKGKLGFAGCAGNGAGLPGTHQPSEPWDEIVLRWEEALHALARQFLAGYAAVDPKNPPKTCSYCDLPLLCRVHEDKLRLAEDEEAEDA